MLMDKQYQSDVFILQVQLLAALHTLAKERESFSWMMWAVLELKAPFWNVLIMELETIIVPTLRMLVLNARVCRFLNVCIVSESVPCSVAYLSANSKCSTGIVCQSTPEKQC